MAQKIWPRAVNCTAAELTALAKNDTGRFFFTGKEPVVANRKAYLESVDGLVELAQVAKVATELQAAINTLKGGGLATDKDTLKKLGDLLVSVQGQITNVNTLLQSNDIDMDSVQELVNFIKKNETTISQLTFANLPGSPNMGLYATLTSLQSAVVADSAKLGGQLPAHYLDYNNLTNKPAAAVAPDLSGVAKYADFVTEL